MQDGINSEKNDRERADRAEVMVDQERAGRLAAEERADQAHERVEQEGAARLAAEERADRLQRKVAELEMHAQPSNQAAS